MDLEKRVEELEKEVELLKVQIQATLLDIQETLLTRSYPDLRVDDDHRSAPSTRPDVRSAVLATEDGDHTRWQNPVRQVRINSEEEHAQEPTSQPAVVRAVKVPAAPPPDITRPQYTEAAPRPKAARNPVANQPKPSQPPQKGVTPPQAPAKPANTQARTRTSAASQTVPSKSSDAAKSATNRTAPKATTPAEAETAASIPEQNSLVLRLIAGIHNAGAGISKKRSTYG